MLPKLFLLFIAAIFLLSGCKKEVAEISKSTALSLEKSVTASVQTLTADPGWYGFYAGPDVFNSDTLFAADIIKNGLAKMPFYSNRREVFSIINYAIPADHNISGDSLIYELRIKNPKDNYHPDWDVFADIKGTEHEAYVSFVADSAYSQYTRAFVGDAQFYGKSQLVHDFETFATLRLVLKSDIATIKLNGTLLGTINYGAGNRVGRVKSILFGGKGYVSCTFVKLLNSVTNKPILTENFNTDGKSTIVYY